MAPTHEVAHLAHIELLTPEPDRSLWFFTQILGLTENGRDGDSVYLRTWDDYEQYTVKLTASNTSGIRRTALRTASQADLERLAQRAEQAGRGIGWLSEGAGIGRSYLCTDPDGHEIQ